uniref:Uncharacterized protein n=1 Tax=Octactis speculum TaxID=3111310 RepID=A0A7S2GNM1_9STRA
MVQNFPGFGSFCGTATEVRRKCGSQDALWTITYDDGDSTTMTTRQLRDAVETFHETSILRLIKDTPMALNEAGWKYPATMEVRYSGEGARLGL